MILPFSFLLLRELKLSGNELMPKLVFAEFRLLE